MVVPPDPAPLPLPLDRRAEQAETKGVEKFWLVDGEERWEEEGKRPLDLVNWENDIVYSALGRKGAGQDNKRREGMAIKIRQPGCVFSRCSGRAFRWASARYELHDWHVPGPDHTNTC